MQRPGRRRRRRRRNENEFRPTREKEKVEEEKNTTSEELRTTHTHTYTTRTTQVANTTTKYLSSQFVSFYTYFFLSRPPRTTLKSTCSHRHDE